MAPARATIRARARATVLLAVAAALASAARAPATVVRALPFDAQCADASRIFVGTVTTVESRRVAAAPRYVETLVTFAVEEPVAGTPGATVTLRFAGGEVDGERHVVDGMPRFAAGERYVVLADEDRTPPLVSAVVGFNQGLYRVVIDAAGAPRVRDATGSTLPPETAGAVLGAGAARVPRADGEIDLPAFLAAIRAARGR